MAMSAEHRSKFAALSLAMVTFEWKNLKWEYKKNTNKQTKMVHIVKFSIKALYTNICKKSFKCQHQSCWLKIIIITF